jgi:hypothetical protein
MKNSTILIMAYMIFITIWIILSAVVVGSFWLLFILKDWLQSMGLTSWQCALVVGASMCAIGSFHAARAFDVNSIIEDYGNDKK